MFRVRDSESLQDSGRSVIKSLMKLYIKIPLCCLPPPNPVFCPNKSLSDELFTTLGGSFGYS